MVLGGFTRQVLGEVNKKGLDKRFQRGIKLEKEREGK